MKKRIVFVTVLVLVFFLTGCDLQTRELYDENPSKLPAIVREYYSTLGITDEVLKNANAEYRTFFHSAEWDGVQIRLPEYTVKLYYLSAGTENYDNEDIKWILFAEKYNADNYDAGHIFRILLWPHQYYLEQEWLQDTPFPSRILGSDERYVYMLQFASDVQYDWENELATSLYQSAYEAKDKVIADFIEINKLESKSIVDK